jgi:hypothetical protein
MEGSGSEQEPWARFRVPDVEFTGYGTRKLIVLVIQNFIIISLDS